MDYPLVLLPKIAGNLEIKEVIYKNKSLFYFLTFEEKRFTICRLKINLLKVEKRSEMRILYTVVLFFLFAVSISAQALNGSNLSGAVAKGGVEVVESRWSMRVHIPMLDDGESPNINYDRDEEIRTMRETLRQERLRSQTGLSLESKTVQIDEDEFRPKPTDPIAIYTYRAKIKNNTEKVIQTVAWDYVFFAPGTKKEVGRRRFANKVKISPGKTGSLMMQSPAPPTGSIKAAKADKKSRVEYDEKVVIQSIEYTDGTVWKAK